MTNKSIPATATGTISPGMIRVFGNTGIHVSSGVVLLNNDEGAAAARNF